MQSFVLYVPIMLDTYSVNVQLKLNNSEVATVYGYFYTKPCYVYCVQAGFCAGNDYVQLALEPEVASLYCIAEMEKSNLNEMTGHHLVVDCGGGTVDIAAHKWERVLSDNSLQVDEIHKVHGGSCGSFAINREFEGLLLDILSTGTDISLADIKKECGSQWSRLLYSDFEKSKCSFANNETNVDVPKPIRTYVKKKCGKTIAELIEDYKNKWDTTNIIVLPEIVHKYLKKSGKGVTDVIEFYKELKWDDEDNAIVVPSGVMTILFSPIIDQIIEIIEDVLKTDAGKLIKYIFMVGGFSESELLFSEVKNIFSSRLAVKSINKPDLAVLFGSIEFAKKHDVIKSRIMHLTLGIETWDDFKIGQHDEERKHTDKDGKSYCMRVFTKFVEIDQVVSTERSNSIKQVFTPIPNEDNISRVNVYGSYERDPMYIDDHCSFLMGEMKIDLPSTSGGTLCEVTVHMDVRGTEITVTAVNNKTHKNISIKLDWMKEF